jgi:hypothetical protein
MNQNRRPSLVRGRQALEVARSTPPYGLHIDAHCCAYRPFTPPYPKGGA